MMKRLFFIVSTIGWILQGPSLTGQTPNYVQYTPKDGLAASTVYCLLQDQRGFMWFGTETGLSRFDGTSFKTFTRQDGLPDNEILEMFEDSKGRIWMLPFRNSICYYSKGSFYTPGNDSILQKLHFRERPLGFYEDSTGVIWINDASNIHKIFPDGTVTESHEIAGIPMRNSFLLAGDASHTLWFSTIDKAGNHIYALRNNQLSLFKNSFGDISEMDLAFYSTQKFWKAGNQIYRISSDVYGVEDTIHMKTAAIRSASYITDSIMILTTYADGAFVYNFSQRRITGHILKGKAISRALRDSEGSWWLATIGEGVFRIQPDNFRNLLMVDATKNGNPIVISSISRTPDGKELLVGSNAYRIFEYTLPDLRPKETWTPSTELSHFRPLGIYKKSEGIDIIADYGIYRLDRNRDVKKRIIPLFPKDYHLSGDTLVLSLINNTLLIDFKSLKTKDTLLPGRSTAVYRKGQLVYIGTLNGLYEVNLATRKTTYLGEKFPVLGERVSDITSTSDGSIWVSTYDNGVICYAGNRVQRQLTMEQGLTSNICRTLYADGSSLWVGTDRGLNRVEMDKDYHVLQITQSDGLGSNTVNVVYSIGDTVLVGTTDGITYFDKSRLGQYSECRLNLLGIYNDQQRLDEQSSYRVSHRNIQVSYVGISYKSAGDIRYQYRLRGVSDEWNTTTETTLEFVQLPFGQYTLEIIAENKFGVKSDTLSIGLTVPVPLWKSSWFYSLIAIFAGLAIYLIYKRRLDTMRKQEEEKTRFTKKVAEMEMKALRAQMNPHFTFNVLNSIQYFIGYNDTASAQRYLSKFSKLIRKTLDNSQEVFVSLEEEIHLLELYLDLEKMRFEDRFVYSIQVDEGLDRKQLLVPNMLIQPFVENSVKHGFREGIKNAEIRILFSGSGGFLDCIITDNGIGREKSAELNRLSGSSSHRSAGLSMIAEKVEALGYYYNYKVSVDVADLHHTPGQPAGTKVTIRMPQKTINA